MKTYLDCIPCFLRQALEAARAVTTDEGVHRQVMKSVAGLVAELEPGVMPPEVVRQIYGLVTEISGNRDPYHAEKQRANRQALALYPRLKELVAESADPLLTACKLAVASNSIDLGPGLKYGELDSIVELALASPLAVNDYEQFRENVTGSRRVLYVGDNAGEIVFDRILIRELKRLKDLSVDFVVRGSPVINDATLADAVYVGLEEVAGVISSGSAAPAMIPAQCSPEVLRLYHSADVIIAKGQGNYESLSEEEKNIFFLLRVKCPVVARLLGASVGDAVLKRQDTASLSG
jgi:uncharacterized protein with ATP-grasp and redox domains